MSYQILNEGRAKFLACPLEEYRTSDREYVPSKAQVFYNPLMKTNRDIMISVLRTLARINDRRIVMGEAMGGLGVRSIRALLETDGIERAYLNDVSEQACELARRNLELNMLSHKAQSTQLDARAFLIAHSSKGHRFDYLDLDPFGSPAHLLEQALLSIHHNGVIGMTATDTAVLFGACPSKALLRYGSYVERVPFMKEMGIRMLIGSSAMTAARHQIGILPLLVYCEKHYLRGYFTVLRDRSRAHRALKALGYLLFSRSALEWKTAGIADLAQSVRSFDHEDAKVYGPLWIGEYVDRDFLQALQDYGSGISIESDNLLAALREEASDIIGYCPVSFFARSFDANVPSPRILVETARRLGLRASLTHLSSESIKLDAQPEEFCRLIGKQGPVEDGNPDR